MSDNFNLSRYRELLKKETILKKQKKLLFHENKVEYLELLSYQASVQRQISYSQRSEYSSLIKEYLDEIITPSRFRAKFLEMRKKDEEKAQMILQDFKQLFTFSIDVKSDGFSSLFRRISNNCL